MTPKRILFANEFGSGHGHHVHLSAIEREIRKVLPNLISHFVLPPHSFSELLVRHENLQFAHELKIPSGVKIARNEVLSHSLCAQFLTNPVVLTTRVALWHRLFFKFKPDLVVADYAPSLSMAAADKVPCLVVGNGYTIPPPELEKSLPVNPHSKSNFQDEEAEWLGKLNTVLHAAGCKKLNYLPEMNKGDDYALFTIPLFDTYWQHRQQKYLGVFHPGGSPQPSKVNDGTVLAYFSKPQDGRRVIDGLIESGLPTIAYLGIPSSEILNRVRSTKVTCVEKPFDLAEELPGRGLAVHAGSLGMSAAGVYAGIPQLGIYQHDEGMSNCRSFAIANIGLSAWIKKTQPDQIAQMITEASNSSTMRNYAHDLSVRYAEFRDCSPAARAVSTALALLS